jgi:hypothetical protein
LGHGMADVSFANFVICFLDPIENTIFHL